MATSLSEELTETILATAGSMWGLETELDRLSLHSMASERGSPLRSKLRRRATVSDSSLKVKPFGRMSRSSSKYDSAIGSLHSQTEGTTDEELALIGVSISSSRKHKSKRVNKSLFDQSEWDWLYHTEEKPRHLNRHVVKKRTKFKRKEPQQRPAADNYSSAPNSADSTPSLPKLQYAPLMIESAQLPTARYLHRGGSIQSLISTDSYSSSNSPKSLRLFNIGLSQDDIFQMTQLPTKSRIKRVNSSVSDIHSPQQQYADSVYVPPPEQFQDASDHESDSSISTVVGDEEHGEDTQQQIYNAPNGEKEQTSFVPDILVIQKQINTPNTPNEDNSLVPEIVVTNQEDNCERSHTNNVTFSDDHLKPVHSNIAVPQKYGEAESSPITNQPKRSASFLQRIKLRRGTSFKLTDRRPRKRAPVRRSFSDRIMDQIKKGKIEYKRDMNFISKPSHVRPIGRMIDKLAGRLHLVQLHRPASGRYGIYITQSSVRKGIFVSRFANANTAKFYSGLIAPGDEIVKVNKERVKEKSVDYVYDIMAKLDSVVFTILPVNSRPDW